MANNRARKIWGKEQRQKADGPSTPKSKKKALADATSRVKKYAKDPKAFYRELLALDVSHKRNKLTHAQSLGDLHDLMLDFLLLAEDNVKRYTKLEHYLPPKDENGEYTERWLYWRTLDRPPEMQTARKVELPDGEIATRWEYQATPDGEIELRDTGPISEMYRRSFWQGVIIRLKGDGLTMALLMPRGHLKSTLGTQALTCWRICRESDSRTLIRSLTGNLAKSFVGDIKFQFEQNEKFRELYGHMVPEKREAPWNSDFIQVKSQHGWRSRGKEPSLQAFGMESEIVGGHVDYTLLDDVQGESNSKTAGLRADACMRVERMGAIRDPGTPLIDIGTRWEDDDVHSRFTRADGSEEDDACFMIATALDGDTKVECSPKLTPLKYGKPIWPEKYNQRDLLKKRADMRDDRVWFGQMFNQFTGTSLRRFSAKWIQRYQGIPEDAATRHKLNIYVFFDTASGKKEQQGKLDYTAGLVIGQTPDRQRYYILDGFKEKLPAAKITQAIVELCRKWHHITVGTNATFWAGVEETAYTNFLQHALELRLRSSHADKHVIIRPASHRNVAKADRILSLAETYAEFRWLWPTELFIRPQDESEPYDLMLDLEEEFTHWPGIQNDDLLDAMAGAYAQMIPPDFKADNRPAPVAQVADRSTYSRADETYAGAAAMGGYEHGWRR